MTKTEFYEEIEDFNDFVDFCERNDFYDIIEDFKHEDDFDDWVWDSIEECRSNSYWYEIKDWLEGLSSPDTEWIRITGFLQYESLYPADLEYWMDTVIDAGDECDFWDPEDDEDEWIEEDEREESEDIEEPMFEAGFALTQLVGVA